MTEDHIQEQSEHPSGELIEQEPTDLRWYVVHTHSGQEKRVRENLDKTVAQYHAEDKIKQILVPSENVAEVRSGKKRISERKFFPGYVLVQMKLDEETWHLVKNTPGVSGFIGAGRKPVALEDGQVASIVEQMKGEQKRPKPKVLFERGEKIKVIEGPFSNFVGSVEEVNPERGKLKVMIEIFERLTPVELEFWQVEKL